MLLERKSTKQWSWVNTLELFLILHLVTTVNVKGELSFDGNGFEVHYNDQSDGSEISEFKMWFRTKQSTGVLMMNQGGDGSMTLVGMYEGKMRCLFIANCASPATWQVLTVSNKSFADGKWHKLMIRRETETALTVCQVDGFIKETTVQGLNFDGVLFLAGLPDSSQRAKVNTNGTCFPDVGNFSGCITGMEISTVDSFGYEQQVVKTRVKQFGAVSSRCAEASDSVISISDKNTKMSLTVKDEGWSRLNASFEFHIRTTSTRAFVTKIMNGKLAALIFLEEGRMKITARIKSESAAEGGSLHLSANGNFLADDQWHRVTLAVVMETEIVLLIDDRLRARQVITSVRNVTTSTVSKVAPQQYVTVRFGRNSRKYPGLVGCLRDVYVNNQAVNFSEHASVRNARGVSVGGCRRGFGEDHVTWRDVTMRPSKEAHTQGGSSLATAITSEVTPSASLEDFQTSTSVTPKVISESSRDSHFEKAYPIAVALGLSIIVLVIVYVFGTSLKTRFKNWRGKNAPEEDAESDLNTSQEKDKDNNAINCSTTLCVDKRSDDALRKVNTLVFANKDELATHYEKLAFAKRRNQDLASVWEEKYRVPSKVADPRHLVPTNGDYSSQSLMLPQSSEKLAGEFVNGRAIIPPLNDRVIVPKNGSCRGLADVTESKGIGGQGSSTAVDTQSPTRLKKVYSGYDSLPRPKKASSLSWAYGRRFVRHESSDTDCSEADTVKGRRQRFQAMGRPGKLITVRPRHLRVLESSENEGERLETLANRNHLGQNKRLRTFTEKTYTLHSLEEEEDRENEPAQRSGSSKVSCRGKSMRHQNRGLSLAEASVLYEEAVSISAQMRCLDGYTSSCPDSIHYLSEKEDKDLYMKRAHSSRHNAFYF